MPVRNIIPNSCRIFWGFMYTIFFLLGWVSFYNTKICSDNVRMVIEGDESKIVALSTYVALGFVVYCLLLLNLLLLKFPLVYLILQVSRKIVNDAKLLLGVKVVNAGCRFLTFTIFPIICIYLKGICEDEASLWASIGIIGSLFCLLVCHADPADYWISDAFVAIWLGVLFNLKNTLGKWVVFTIIVVSIFFSNEVIEIQIGSESEFEVQ